MSQKEQEELLNMRKNINTILNQDISFKKLSSIKIDNLDIAKDNLVISSIFIFIWIFIWFVFRFFDIGNYVIFFFILYILIEIYNIIKSATTIETNNTFSSVKYNDAISKGETFLCIMVILYIFVFNMNLDHENKKIIYKLLSVILGFSCLLLFKIKFKDNSRNMRNLILIDKKINNQIIILFMMCIYLIFIYNKKI
jgi:hypothetical protein